MYPFVLSVLLIIFWLFYKLRSFEMDYGIMLEKFLISLSITIILLMPSIFTATANYLNCQDINDHSYISTFLIERCDNNERYTFWKIRLIWPCFFLFNLAFPLSLFIYMFRNKYNLFQEKIIYKIGFLLNGYSSHTFYWYYFCLIIFLSNF